MLYLNHTELIGNLTRDPELRYTNNNQSVCSFAIATNRRYKDQSGTWVDAPAEYHELVIWGTLGERCSQVLHKGDRIFVSGRSQTRSWEAPDGTKKYKTELVVDAVIGPDVVNKNMAGGAYTGNTEDTIPDSDSAGSPSASSKKKKATPAEEEINIDDIPF